MEAIEKSRRTILLISPEYVIRDEWVQYAEQVAQHEILRRRSRIIPILLRDISDVMDRVDPTLRYIMDGLSYLEWPGKDDPKKEALFWKKLRLCMPKKKVPPPADTAADGNKADDGNKANGVLGGVMVVWPWYCKTTLHSTTFQGEYKK